MGTEIYRGYYGEDYDKVEKNNFNLRSDTV